MVTDGSEATKAPPSAIDLLLEVPNAYDRGAPGQGVDSRLRIGSARSDQSTTRTDAELVQHVLTAIPEAQRPAFSGEVTALPSVTDPHADVKRALRYDGPTGFGFVTTGQLSKYLGGSEVTRIVDGSFRVHAVDQADGGPVLSYLRLGKAEPRLGSDYEGNPVEGAGTPLTPQLDRAMDAKYTTGIGAYTEGEINIYSRGETSIRSTGPYRIKSRGYTLSSIGEQRTASFDGGDADGDGLPPGGIAPGSTAEPQADTTLVSVDWRYKRADGWYKQSYERGKKVSFSTSNTGEISTSAKYGLSAGVSFDHKLSAGLDTGYSATVEVKGETKVKVTANGFESETLFGKFSVADKVELAGNGSVDISCARLVDVGVTAVMKKFSTVVRAATAVQNAAFIAYEAALAVRAEKTTVDPSKAADDLELFDEHGFTTAFKQGPKIYEAAISISAGTCAAGILLAAVQAAMSKAPDPGVTPRISMTPFEMKLSAGPLTSITLDQFGIQVRGSALGMRGMIITIASPRTVFQIS